MALNFRNVKEKLDEFAFRDLFVEELGWNPPPSRTTEVAEAEDVIAEVIPVAELGGVIVLEVRAEDGTIPDAKVRRALHKVLTERYLENLLIFVDGTRKASLWVYAKRDGTKTVYRDHPFVQGQPGDLFVSKLSGMIFDVSDFDEKGDVRVTEVATRLRSALDVERVTKRFYEEFKDQQLAFVDLITGIPDDRQRRWYASVLLNRLMFVYFMQRKGFVDQGARDYLQGKLAQVTGQGGNYYKDFLLPLFFEGFAKPPEHRSDDARRLLGTIPYLNGGLFLEHVVERDNPNIEVPDEAFVNLLGLFARYSWNLNDLPGADDNEINPDVLGYIFEKYINQKAFGAYYTRPEITEYLCDQTVDRLVLEAVNRADAPGRAGRRAFDTIGDLLFSVDAPLCTMLLNETLPNLSLLDPACGSGAFLVAALKKLTDIYGALLGRISVLNDRDLHAWFEKIHEEHPSVGYFIKKRVITDNLYGVDIMEEATDIAKLRLFLALVVSVERAEDLEPLPNIDFNIVPGNSLIGLTHVDPNEFDRRGRDGTVQSALFGSLYADIVADYTARVDAYKQAEGYREDQAQVRDEIQTIKEETNGKIDNLLLHRFWDRKIQVGEATWDDARKREGKSRKRSVTIVDIEALTPFHWGFEFPTVMTRGGFDAIITNPPWDVFEAHEKEFFQGYVPGIQQNRLRIEDWQAQQADLMQQPILRDAWLKYSSRFSHVAQYFKTSPQYANQISLVDGRNIGSKINLYSYFLEQSFNLLRDGGQCGIVIPSGIYTDLGVKQLREMLFGQTKVTGLFGFENRREIFEGVHRSFKFVVLSFSKGGSTESFPATFMRLETSDLELFPEQLGLEIPVELVKRLSPDSLSVMEFKNDVDVQIAEKLARFPLLGEELSHIWNITLQAEFNMTTRSYLFKSAKEPHYVPLYEGKMLHQFNHLFELPRYWLDVNESRKAVLGKTIDRGQSADYQFYRLGFRKIARNTDTRTLISTIIPPNFHSESFHSVKYFDENGNKVHSPGTLLYLCALWNSFVTDWVLRQKVTANVNMFYVYQLPMPRLTATDPVFNQIVEHCARLICTTPEFDDLAAEVGLGSHTNGVTDLEERAALRAELDGIIAHLYGLTEDEFAYILTTFPLVDESVKTAALAAFNRLAPTEDDTNIVRLIAEGEGATLEFKSTARVNLHTNQADKRMEEVILKTVAGFWNAEGGTLLVGVADDGTVVGVESDLTTLGRKNNLDGLELFLTDLLLGGRLNLAGLLKTSFHSVGGKTVCKLAVEPAPEPVWVTTSGAERLYVRTGNSTRELAGSDAFSYARRKWV